MWGGKMDTQFYDLEQFDEAKVRDVLNEVKESLSERGYNPVNQIVGYLMSGDPGYISSHRDARSKMKSLERSKILETLLKCFMEQD